MDRAELRPGVGWKYLAGSVWTHTSGARMHLWGVVRLPDGSHISATNFPEYFEAGRLIKINGGNRRRGLMAWAVKKVKEKAVFGLKQEVKKWMLYYDRQEIMHLEQQTWFDKRMGLKGDNRASVRGLIRIDELMEADAAKYRGKKEEA